MKNKEVKTITDFEKLDILSEVILSVRKARMTVSEVGELLDDCECHAANDEEVGRNLKFCVDDLYLKVLITMDYLTTVFDSLEELESAERDAYYLNKSKEHDDIKLSAPRPENVPAPKSKNYDDEIKRSE